MSRSQQRMYELTGQQCRERIAADRARLGRVAFAEDGDPDWPTVLPVNYAWYDGGIYMRTFEGSKLYAALRGQRVAFEIDVVDPEWAEGWSVLAVGRLQLVVDPAAQAAVDEVLDSWAEGPQHMLRLNIEQLTGRQLIGGGS